jgi:hypothetical protein
LRNRLLLSGCCKGAMIYQVDDAGGGEGEVVIAYSCSKK